MTDQGPSSAKQTRYMLRSNTRSGLAIAEHNESTDGKRKRKGPLRLMDLNDDCLLAVFGNMNVIELSDVAETCKRTQELVQYTFRLKHHHRLDLISLAGHNLKLALRLLRNFGGHASSLNMTRNVLFSHKQEAASRKLLSLIAKYCRPNTLTELSLSRFIITPASMKDLKELFGSLEILKLENTTIKDCDLSPFKDNLKVLKLKDSDFCDSTYRFPVYKPLITFVNTTTALQVLSICSSTRLTQSRTRVYQAISELKDLEELELNERSLGGCEKTFQRICTYLFALNNLKVLKINCHGYSVQQLVEGLAANNIAIEHLSVTCVKFGDIFDDAIAIGKLKTIKVLKLLNARMVIDAHLLIIVNDLKLLSELVVTGWISVNVTQQGIVEMLREADRLSCLKINTCHFQFNIGTYDEMLAIIKNRPEHIKLQLIFGHWSREPFDPEGNLRSNDKLLSVKAVSPLFNIQ
ncbi:uncharacterized protein LOC129574903 [Sitodiplosis mosellana]|uniref:uncharacterized protein LOC129574903 n=1 Tax=Sitodiplosis mosellana TaxID=263140 RepID=UPI002443C9AE|nr:uncharacterized protein LOC129574903 [Sitodiplosis mosellana]